MKVTIKTIKQEQFEIEADPSETVRGLLPLSPFRPPPPPSPRRFALQPEPGAGTQSKTLTEIAA